MQGWVQNISVFEFVFEYRNFVYMYLNWKSQKGLYLIFGLYLQIQPNTHIKLPKKGKALLHIACLAQQSRIFCHRSGRINSGQAALRKSAYSEVAGQTLAPMIEWEANEAYHCP